MIRLDGNWGIRGRRERRNMYLNMEKKMLLRKKWDERGIEIGSIGEIKKLMRSEGRKNMEVINWKKKVEKIRLLNIGSRKDEDN